VLAENNDVCRGSAPSVGTEGHSGASDSSKPFNTDNEDSPPWNTSLEGIWNTSTPSSEVTIGYKNCYAPISVNWIV